MLSVSSRYKLGFKVEKGFLRFIAGFPRQQLRIQSRHLKHNRKQ